MIPLLQDVKIVRCSGAAVAARSQITGDIIDMADYEGVLFVAQTADVDSGCVLTLACQQDTAAGGGTMATLSGNATYTALSASDSDNKELALNVHRPAERYVRPILTRTTADAAINGIVAILYGPRNRPVTQPATVLDSDTLLTPAEA